MFLDGGTTLLIPVHLFDHLCVPCAMVLPKVVSEGARPVGGSRVLLLEELECKGHRPSWAVRKLLDKVDDLLPSPALGPQPVHIVAPRWSPAFNEFVDGDVPVKAGGVLRPHVLDGVHFHEHIGRDQNTLLPDSRLVELEDRVAVVDVKAGTLHFLWA